MAWSPKDFKPVHHYSVVSLTLPFILYRQDGTVGEDVLSQVVVGQDGGVVLVGYSTGTWGDELDQGEEDFVVVKLDGEGSELWRWQVRRSSVAESFCLRR